MNTYTCKGTFTYTEPKSNTEYEIDYSATLRFDDNQRRGDEAECEPAHGTDFPEDLWESVWEDIEEQAITEAYKQLKEESED